jgi:hypothetical protein
MVKIHSEDIVLESAVQLDNTLGYEINNEDMKLLLTRKNNVMRYILDLPGLINTRYKLLVRKSQTHGHYLTPQEASLCRCKTGYDFTPFICKRSRLI